MPFPTIADLGDLRGKTALVRADLNVPMVDGRVTEDSRLRAVVPTVRALRDAGARVVLLSHFGRPKGERRPDMSLEPLVAPLADLLGEPVAFGDDCIGEPAMAALDKGQGVTLLENLRFHPGEEDNDPGFADALAALGDVYINDAFSAAHRAHASTEALAHRLAKAAGESLRAELEALEKALGTPDRPVAAIVGGAKVSTKLKVLEHLIDKVDHLIIGGAMANTFLAAQGVDVKASLFEADLVDTARQILNAAAAKSCAVHLPDQVVVAEDLATGVPSRIVPLDQLHAGDKILDIGPASAEQLADLLGQCRTLVWNGPLGAFEISPFDRATVKLARAAADLTEQGRLISVAGGGDTVAALVQAQVRDRLSHVSTAGGAFLEWMEGRELPGVAALMAKA
ncbi:MAG: phosphoglycerate kinase [Rhodothalassiaceae bacterium]